MKITLLGAGAWGTALSIAFAGKHELTLWSREDDVAADLEATRENHRFFRATSCRNQCLFRRISLPRWPMPNC